MKGRTCPCAWRRRGRMGCDGVADSLVARLTCAPLRTRTRGTIEDRRSAYRSEEDRMWNNGTTVYLPSDIGYNGDEGWEG